MANPKGDPLHDPTPSYASGSRRPESWKTRETGAHGDVFQGSNSAEIVGWPKCPGNPEDGGDGEADLLHEKAVVMPGECEYPHCDIRDQVGQPAVPRDARMRGEQGRAEKACEATGPFEWIHGRFLLSWGGPASAGRSRSFLGRSRPRRWISPCATASSRRDG